MINFISFSLLIVKENITYFVNHKAVFVEMYEYPGNISKMGYIKESDICQTSFPLEIECLIK